ncbi:MAG: DNA translocase FtsK 4TM domain-containing protein, partial [Anaerolineae bacterium]|nr:DNA translocase FtsK 4TM domain-containing protein [Anaerolineae bacterium]
MPQRKYQKMARQRSGKRNRTVARTSTQSSTTKAKSSSLLQKITDSVMKWIIGPVGQQLLALVLIALGILTLFTIAGLNSGALVNAWARAVVFAFGWAAYPVAATIAATGLLWLRHLAHQPTAWRWRPFLGFQLVLLGMQTLTWVLIQQQNWRLVESGKSGGVVGWALYLFFSGYFGTLITGVLMGLLVIVGLFLAFDTTSKDLQGFGRRLSEVWSAWKMTRGGPGSQYSEPYKTSGIWSTTQATTAQLSEGIAVSPIAKHTATPPEPVISKPPVRKAPPKRSRKKQSTSMVSVAPLSLLRQTQTVGMNQNEIQQKSRIIEETLAQFGVPGRVTEVRPGPTVTQFGVAPGYISRSGDNQRKVRVSQIASLADDLALALAARSLRVEAPVPGRAIVGIEVPNAETNLVGLRAVLESDAFNKCGKPLCVAIGLDVAGSPQVTDLAKMPHLLVAGTTGSGKSVFVKAMAASLVMHNTPESLRLVAIDPKMVELTHLNGLPHLLGPTETELERVLSALRWVAHEMDRRYKLFASYVARNLDDYNAKIARKKKETAEDDADVEILPRIVVLIDELADLMMSAPEETERTLTRIAQMARATGIHMVVATQRPSTDVVTGLIKANFPARVSFATTSIVDSRVIIDMPGAESLMGRGDMLFLPPEASTPVRVQGCFISDEELEAIKAFWQKEEGATPAK